MIRDALKYDNYVKKYYKVLTASGNNKIVLSNASATCSKNKQK